MPVMDGVGDSPCAVFTLGRLSWLAQQFCMMQFIFLVSCFMFSNFLPWAPGCVHSWESLRGRQSMQQSLMLESCWRRGLAVEQGFMEELNSGEPHNSNMDKKAKGFIIRNKENADFNQYWYSEKTIAFLAQQAIASPSAVFLSAPSIFYAIDNPNFEKPYYVFDLDDKFGKKNPNFFKYDFNKPEEIPESFHHKFDFVLADPPFITHEVWAKYAEAIRLLIRKDEAGGICGKILLSTIDENEQFLGKELGVKKRKFKPSIPHLVYQYSLYSNYENQQLDQVNEEIGE